MARRSKHSILVYGPRETAKRAIDHLKDKYEEAKANPAVRKEWMERYFNDIGEYVENAERRKEAEEKLATWYEVLISDVAPNYARAMQEAKAKYYKRLAEKLSTGTFEFPEDER